jgi:hypothetical protein
MWVRSALLPQRHDVKRHEQQATSHQPGQQVIFFIFLQQN